MGISAPVQPWHIPTTTSLTLSSRRLAPPCPLFPPQPLQVWRHTQCLLLGVVSKPPVAVKHPWLPLLDLRPPWSSGVWSPLALPPTGQKWPAHLQMVGSVLVSSAPPVPVLSTHRQLLLRISLGFCLLHPFPITGPTGWAVFASQPFPVSVGLLGPEPQSVLVMVCSAAGLSHSLLGPVSVWCQTSFLAQTQYCLPITETSYNWKSEDRIVLNSSPSSIKLPNSFSSIS